MSVSLALLGLLEQHPRHGYELKRDYDTLFGERRRLHVGQVYSTLERLQRDARVFVCPGDTAERLVYCITDVGQAELDAWLRTPESPHPYVQPGLYVKVVLALLCDRSAGDVLDRQRVAHRQQMQEYARLGDGGSLRDVVMTDLVLHHLQADLQWMDATESRLEDLRAELGMS